MRSSLGLIFVTLAACGNDGKDGTNNTTDAGTTGGPDAFEFRDAMPTTTVQVTITGTATERTASGAAAMADVLLVAYRKGNETAPIGMTTTDGFGDYTLTIQTNGEAIDGFLKATKLGYKETYLYPPYPLTADFNGASVIMVTEQTYDALSTLAQGNQQPGNGLMGLIVTDGTNPVAGATVSTTPASGVSRYNEVVGSLVLPTANATATHTDGVAYIFNVPAGQVTVNASHPTLTLNSHGLKAWPDQLTTTVVVPP